LVIAKQEFVEARKKFTLRDHRKGVDLQIPAKSYNVSDAIGINFEVVLELGPAGVEPPAGSQIFCFKLW